MLKYFQNGVSQEAPFYFSECLADKALKPIFATPYPRVVLPTYRITLLKRPAKGPGCPGTPQRC